MATKPKTIENETPQSFLWRVIFYMRSSIGIVVVLIVCLLLELNWLIPLTFLFFLLFYLARTTIWAKYDIISIILEGKRVKITYKEFYRTRENSIDLERTQFYVKKAFVKGDLNKLIITSANVKVIQYENKFWTKDKMEEIKDFVECQ